MTDDRDRHRFVLAFEHIRDSVLKNRDKTWPDLSCRCEVVRWDRVEGRPVLWHDTECPRDPGPLLDAREDPRKNQGHTNNSGAAPVAPGRPHDPRRLSPVSAKHATALVIPVEGPVQSVDLDGTLDQLQQLVGGRIEALPVPEAFTSGPAATAYVNEEGKWESPPNMRATDFLVPGVGLWPNDYIAGPMVVCGFDPKAGENRTVPPAVERRVRLIEKEAGQ